MTPQRIDKKFLEAQFREQKLLAEKAIETTGVNAYMENLGFDSTDTYKWARSYVQANYPDMPALVMPTVVATLVRGMSFGVVLGRQTNA